MMVRPGVAGIAAGVTCGAVGDADSGGLTLFAI
jgi:hypothetical protein